MFLRTKKQGDIYVFNISYKLEEFFFERGEQFLAVNTTVRGITPIESNLT